MVYADMILKYCFHTFALLLLSICWPKTQEENSVVEYQWSVINFTWESQEAYKHAIETLKYIPQNNGIFSIKFYKSKLYLSNPRSCPGIPVTLGYIATDEETSKINRLITPFPDWSTNDFSDYSCDKLENVAAIEIDANGTMWVVDGQRLPNSHCPPKLVLYDLNDSSIIHKFTFPESVLTKSSVISNIVVDDTDGGFAYITDTSRSAPGLVVYSKAEDNAWKLQDPSMFPDVKSFETDEGIAGIALSPKTGPGPRKVYYSVFGGLNLYSVDTNILKNVNESFRGYWRRNVVDVGKKKGQSVGMIIDNIGNLYYGLSKEFEGIGIGTWNIYEPFSLSEVTEGYGARDFAFDDKGYLYEYVLSAQMLRYINSSCKSELPQNNDVNFKIVKRFTGTKSYLH